MTIQSSIDQNRQSISENENRTQLLADLPVNEHQLELAGISSAVLVGGEGPPVVLLHGPGETSIWWMRVIPKLVKTHRVIVPDLPGHGASKVMGNPLDKDKIFEWLNELFEKTCSSPPILVGNILGGSIGARFAVNHGEQLSQLILVNSLGLGKFRPAPRFAFGLFRFMLWPTEKNFSRFFPQCMYDVDDLRDEMGDKWDFFVAYNLECAQDKERSSALQTLMKKLGIPKIPSGKLEKIDVPTALIWGRHDRANKLKIAEKASNRYGWPLHIIEETRDDPKLERPDEFLEAFYKTIKQKEEHFMTKREKNPYKKKPMEKNKQLSDAKNGLKVPENYERFFVPAIGKPLAQELVRQAKLQEGERVLDVACGTGIVARLASDQVGVNGSVTGLDVNPGMLAVARSVTPVDRSIEWYESSAEAMPLPDKEYNVVFCQIGLQFMEDKPAALQEMHRVLKPGGRLFLNVPGPAGDLFVIFTAAMKRTIGPEAAGFVNHVFSLNDTTEIQQLIKNADFREVSVKAEKKMITLPPPKKFLWQYVQSTPLYGVISKVGEEARKTLEREIVEKWQDFEEGGTMSYQQQVITVTAQK